MSGCWVARARATRVRVLISSTPRSDLFVRPVLPDGNCLFRAVALHVYGTEDAHMRVRLDTCKHIRMHRDHFGSFVGDVDAYTSFMEKDRVWGGNVEICALQEMFDRCDGPRRARTRSAADSRGRRAQEDRDLRCDHDRRGQRVGRR